MSELPIPAEAIEAAIDSYVTSTGRCQEGAMERAFRKGLEAWGFEVEQCFVDGTDPYIGYRVISRWLPVEQGER